MLAQNSKKECNSAVAAQLTDINTNTHTVQGHGLTWAPDPGPLPSQTALGSGSGSAVALSQGPKGEICPPPFNSYSSVLSSSSFYLISIYHDYSPSEFPGDGSPVHTHPHSRLKIQMVYTRLKNLLSPPPEKYCETLQADAHLRASTGGTIITCHTGQRSNVKVKETAWKERIEAAPSGWEALRSLTWHSH